MNDMRLPQGSMLRPPSCSKRAAARYFGVSAYAAHVNGLVRLDGELAMWIARRSPAKSIDPGMLDNLVGGGIAAGVTHRRHGDQGSVGGSRYRSSARANRGARGHRSTVPRAADGLQRETIYVHDLVLPVDFAPANQDGEVSDYRRVSLGEAARLVAETSGPGCRDWPDASLGDRRLPFAAPRHPGGFARACCALRAKASAIAPCRRTR
jgi:hypothetical protein